MKKGDRIRCKRACGELPKGAEGICIATENDRYGYQAKFDLYGENIYSLGKDWTTHFEVVKTIAGLGGICSALDIQQGGTHYKNLKIQPIEYIHANNIPFAEGCAIKYLTRWRAKGGVGDLEKAKHFIELLIELEKKNDSLQHRN